MSNNGWMDIAIKHRDSRDFWVDICATLRKENKQLKAEIEERKRNGGQTIAEHDAEMAKLYAEIDAGDFSSLYCNAKCIKIESLPLWDKEEEVAAG